MFKKIFGTVGNEALLKSFLNAILSDKDLPLIEEITILENRELVREFNEDKLGIIDVHAKTIEGEVINIEVQMWNEYNQEDLIALPVEDSYELRYVAQVTHFIQLPAFRKKHEKNFKTHDLERWLTFLTQEIEEKEWEELVLMDKDISKAYDQIKYLLSDEEIVQIAEARERLTVPFRVLVRKESNRVLNKESLRLQRK